MGPTAALATLVDPGNRLDFVEAGLNADIGWREAVVGCDYVLHMASPLPLANPKSDDELVRPARDGALRVLAAIAYGRGGRSTPFTEVDWLDETNLGDTSADERSKTIAERAAWAWMKSDGQGLELVTINPGAVVGPVLGYDYSVSIDIVRKLMDGSLLGLPRFGWPLVDVRDIADLHVRAMTHPAAAGQRFIGGGSF